MVLLYYMVNYLASLVFLGRASVMNQWEFEKFELKKNL